MLTVTDKAAAYLREALTRKKEGTPEALRVVYTEEGYELTLDDPKEGDHIFELEGHNYLLVDTEVGEALGEEATLDLQETPHGASLTLLGAHSPQPEAEAETKAKADAKAKAEPQPEAEPKANAEPQPEA
jgi:Fe-S cluster assembly iron-binding protein IscA